MSTICGADCEQCTFKCNCHGCENTCGRPFGGDCIAAGYIKVGGVESYAEFKRGLTDEINVFLTSLGIRTTDALYELPGMYVNLTYRLPSGESVRFLDDNKIYLGCQIEFSDCGVCYGVVADTTFILVCSYSMNGSNPELIAYKKR